MNSDRPPSLYVRFSQAFNFLLGPGGQASLIYEIPNAPQLDAASAVSQDQTSQNVQSATSAATTASFWTSSQPTQTSAQFIAESTTSSATSQTTSQASSQVSSQPSSEAPSQTTSHFLSQTSQTSIVTVTSTASPGASSTSLSDHAITSTIFTAPNNSSTSSPSATPPPSVTTAAVIIVTSTSSDGNATPTSTSSSSSAALSKHSPPFYIGIVLGVIVIIACVTALVAWGIRIRSHARRRHTTKVPWANSDDNDGELEEGRDRGPVTSLTASLGVGGMITQEDLLQAHTWEPRGDRDVGEPKRTESYQNSGASTRHAMRDPFADDYRRGHYPARPSVDSAMNPFSSSNARTSRPFPPHLASTFGSVSVDGHSSIHTLGPLQVANMMPGDSSAASSRAGTASGVSSDQEQSNFRPDEFGPPREVVPGSKPRFLGLDGEGLKVPWRPAFASLSHAAASTPKPAVGRGWSHLPPLPMPGESGRDEDLHCKNPDADAWSSLRANLVNAFHTVAGNRGPGTVEKERGNEDKLSPVPIKRKLAREADWQEFGGRVLTRETTLSSAGWSLEEKSNGAGIVHIRGLECYGRDHDFSPQLRESMVTLDDGSFLRPDSEAGLQRVTTHESQIPLINVKGPRADDNPGLSDRVPQYGVSSPSPSGKNALLRARSEGLDESRSFSSGHQDDQAVVHQAPFIPAISRTSTITMGALRGKSRKRRNNMASRMSRFPSTNSSLALYGNDDTHRAVGSNRLQEKEDAAKKAMLGLRKKDHRSPATRRKMIVDVE